VHYWNTKLQGFLPNAKDFRLNSAYGLPNQGYSAGIAPRDLYFCVFGSSGPECVQGKTRFTDANTEKIIAVQARELKVLYLLPISNIPDTI
jgi:hypothetical protein